MADAPRPWLAPAPGACALRECLRPFRVLALGPSACVRHGSPAEKSRLVGVALRAARYGRSAHLTRHDARRTRSQSDPLPLLFSSSAGCFESPGAFVRGRKLLLTLSDIRNTLCNIFGNAVAVDPPCNNRCHEVGHGRGDAANNRRVPPGNAALARAAPTAASMGLSRIRSTARSAKRGRAGSGAPEP